MQDGMLCLDSYALVEIHEENKNYAFVLNQEFVIPNSTLAEFYQTIYRKLEKQTADYWLNKLSAYSANVNLDIWIKAMVYRHEHKTENLSVFDCIGYIFAQENKLKFVTGDKQFKNKKGVLFVKS
jgi:hypothetical protein